ncbi:BgtE-5575 [Blumeria graminis f. sp. tritici]|uniref:BgtE-5575 n=2 Tax=Blumeria graminis f. sp. tritici TaxID=62690 RepID=A0A381LGN8_BLUGR|nr:putative secreted effector protein [Blumeria graminis f. sp. tritici 96224]VDB92900.1 BgtE-5575 [Blumeria graminis f. sp. tritici]
MVYIYALLLIPSSISKIPGRVVFSNTLPINNFQSTIRNDVYKLSNSEFPKPEDNSGIFMAIDDSRTPGTHHAVYSAPNMPYADMIARIMGGASPLTDEQVINLDKDAIAVQECHQYLQSKAQEVDTVMPLSFLNVVKSNKCTARSIATLASEDKVKVEGKHNYFAPYLSTSSIRIDADYIIKLEDLVLPEQSTIYKGSRTPRAFVWYQGRPHLVFGCIEDKRAWFITSTIMGRRERRSLDGAILLVNNRYGKKESLVKKSRLGIELDLKRYSKINPTVDPYTNGRVSIVRLSNPPEKMPGVLVDWYDCLSYKSSSPKLFDWGARSKPS